MSLGKERLLSLFATSFSWFSAARLRIAFGLAALSRRPTSSTMLQRVAGCKPHASSSTNSRRRTKAQTLRTRLLRMAIFASRPHHRASVSCRGSKQLCRLHPCAHCSVLAHTLLLLLPLTRCASRVLLHRRIASGAFLLLLSSSVAKAKASPKLGAAMRDLQLHGTAAISKYYFLVRARVALAAPHASY